MWSGPRNISTAMMRSWGNRDDCTVVDEPLYAYYLAATGKPHPGTSKSSPPAKPTGKKSSPNSRLAPAPWRHEAQRSTTKNR